MEFLKIWGPSLFFFAVVCLAARRRERKAGPRRYDPAAVEHQRELEEKDRAMWAEHWDEIARRRVQNTDF